MFISQISVFLENKPGKLSEVIDAVAREGIDISAISIADTTEFGVLRMIADKPEEAVAAIRRAGFPVSTTDVLAVEVPDRPGGLGDVLKILKDERVSIEYIYSFIKRNSDKALILFKTEDPGKAASVLKTAGIRLYTNEEISAL